VTPPHDPGTVDVRVATAGAKSVTGPRGPGGASLGLPTADDFTYTPETDGGNPIGDGQDDGVSPLISSIDPNFGPTGGGTRVAVVGKRLNGATSVSFGQAEITRGCPAGGGTGQQPCFTVVDEAHLIAYSPSASRAGPVHVTVTTGAGKSAETAADIFEYREPGPPLGVNKGGVEGSSLTSGRAAPTAGAGAITGGGGSLTPGLPGGSPAGGFSSVTAPVSSASSAGSAAAAGQPMPLAQASGAPLALPGIAMGTDEAVQAAPAHRRHMMTGLGAQYAGVGLMGNPGGLILVALFTCGLSPAILARSRAQTRCPQPGWAKT
ncbi:MAG: IPT/TIG domain-containing protein, partial [Actinomycetota bacterium]